MMFDALACETETLTTLGTESGTAAGLAQIICTFHHYLLQLAVGHLFANANVHNTASLMINIVHANRNEKDYQ